MPEYDRCPIIEAIFEFGAAGATLSDATTRRLREEFASRYGGRTDSVPSGFMYQVEMGPTGPKPRSPVQVPPRYRFWSRDSATLVQFGHDLFAFNALPPYRHYVEYLPAMEREFETYRTAIGSAVPVAFLGQRYLNQIVLPGLDERPSDYFSVYPPSPTAMRPAHRPFSVQIQVEEIQRGQVVITLTYQGPDAERRPQYLLDIYARTVDNPAIDFEWNRVRAWQDVAHAAITRAFEFALTDRCRTLLGGRTA